jgi:hypothetical protein
MVNNGIYKPDTFDGQETFHIRTLTARRNILQGHKTYRDNRGQQFNKKEAEELEALNWVLDVLDEISHD